MQLHMHSHHWEPRLPDWPAAAVSGFGGGAVLMVLELLWTTNVIGSSSWSTSHMIAAIVMGREALQSIDFNFTVVTVALVTHYVLGIVFGIILSVIIAPVHFDSNVGMAVVSGTGYGLGL